MKDYFNLARCLEDVKELYKKYVLELHPDKGGNMWDFIEMKKQYDSAFNRLKNIHRTFDENNNEKFYEKVTDEVPAEYANLIDILINFEGVKIELLGKWLWLSGNTKPYKEKIKNLGFRWSKKKLAWYNTFGYLSVTNRYTQQMNMDALREHWQAQEIKKNKSINLSLA